MRVLAFDISADWPKNAKFNTRKHCYYALRTLESVDPVPFPRTNRKKISTRKVFCTLKSQINVPANNCHPKGIECDWGCRMVYLLVAITAKTEGRLFIFYHSVITECVQSEIQAQKHLEPWQLKLLF